MILHIWKLRFSLARWKSMETMRNFEAAKLRARPTLTQGHFCGVQPNEFVVTAGKQFPVSPEPSRAEF